MIITAEILEELEKVDPNTRAIFIKLFKHIKKAIGELITRKEFLELTKEVSEVKQELRELTKQVQALTKAVQELTEAHKRSEKRINKLEEAQIKAEERLTRLEEAPIKLTEEHKKTREQLGGLSRTVGYLLEDRAYQHLPKLLKAEGSSFIL
ncbi:MAG: hypothetical protein ACK4LA_00795 [Aquificaceae bacterium]